MINTIKYQRQLFNMFSLKKYLNESLQSNSLYKEILNEPGGLFRYFQVLPIVKLIQDEDNKETYMYGNNHTLIGDAKVALKKMQDICSIVFDSTEVPAKGSWRDRGFKKNMPIEKVKRLNNEYNKAVKDYLYAMKHIFDSPKPRVFGEFVKQGPEVDLFNITDDHFKKMTYLECRKDKDQFQQIIDSKRSIIFWFDSDHYLLAISRVGKIVQFGTKSVDTENYNKRHYFPVYTTRLEMNTLPEKLVDDIRTDTLSDGTEIIWPHLANSAYGDKQYGFNYINNRNLILPRNGYGNYTPYVVGNPFFNTSPIRAKAGWDKDGYVIIYTPEEFVKDEEGRPKNIGMGGHAMGYNDWKALRQQSRRVAYGSMSKKYKWNRDEDGKIIPYTIDGIKYIYEIDDDGKAVATEVSNNIKYADAFNYKIRKTNIEHYQYLIKQNSSNKDVIKFGKAVKDLSNKLLTYIEKVEAIEDKLPLDSHYAYNLLNYLNGALYDISQMKFTLEEFENYINNRDDDEDATEANTTRGIQRYMTRLKNYNDSINDAFENIDKIFNYDEFKKLIEE